MSDPVKARTRAMYATLKRRAGNDPLAPSLADLRRLFHAVMLVSPFCPFCRVTLTTKNVSLDHARPLSRGGTNQPENLLFVCGGCNTAKGNRTDGEFKDIMKALDEIGARHRNPKLRDDVRGDLMRAASFKIGANRRAKKR